MPRGGKRPGAGGDVLRVQESKNRLKAHLRSVVGKHWKKMLEAQIANAEGIKYLVLRDPRTGRFERLDPGEYKGKELPDGTIEVWAKDPSIQAFTDLANRAIDKPAEPEVSVAVKGAIVIRWAQDPDDDEPEVFDVTPPKPQLASPGESDRNGRDPRG